MKNNIIKNKIRVDCIDCNAYPVYNIEVTYKIQTCNLSKYSKIKSKFNSIIGNYIPRFSFNTIENMIKYDIISATGTLVASMSVNDIKTDRYAFVCKLHKYLKETLSKRNLTLLCIDVYFDSF